MASRNKREGALDGFVRGHFARKCRVGIPAMLWSRNNRPINRKQRKIAKRSYDKMYYSPSYYSQD